MEEAATGIYDHVFQGVHYGTCKEKKQHKSEPTPCCGPHPAKSVDNLIGGGQEALTGFVHIIHTIVLTGLLVQKLFQRLTCVHEQCVLYDLWL
jgi:hypothetical protein